MKYRAIIFDFDGTLVDSLDDITDAMNRVLELNGFPSHTREEYRLIVGRGIRDLVIRSLPPGEAGGGTVDRVHGMYLAGYRENCLAKTRPYAGIIPLLEKLRDMGITLAILSNKAQEFTRYMADALFPPGLFSVVSGGRDGVPSKPDPYLALEIAGILGIDPGAFLLAGDSASDMMTARNASMTGVGVLWGYRDRDDIESGGAGYVIVQPSDMLDLLRG